jgi:hypothetical protein
LGQSKEEEEKTSVDIWKISTSANAKDRGSASPAIPEPAARLSPTGSGISVRKLPAPSFTALRKACHFYELKCSGKYSSKTPAARYLFELSREVQSQLVSLEKSDAAKMRRIGFLESLVKEWEDVFGSPTDDDLRNFQRGDSKSTIISPSALATLLREQQGKIVELEGVIETARREKQEDLARFEGAVNDHFKISRQQYLLEVHRIKKEYDDEAATLRRTLNEEISIAKQERKEMKNSLLEEKERAIAEAVADIDRRVQEATKKGIDKAKDEKALGLAKIHNIRQALQLERMRITAELEKKESLVDDAIQRVNRQHEIELSRLKSNHAKAVAKAIERGRSKEKATSTKVSNLRLENDWLRKRVGHLQGIVEALQEASAVHLEGFDEEAY